jgi:Ca-activated chloride channel family protein
MFEFGAPWAWLLLPAPILIWWLLPPYREQVEAVRIPFFEQFASALGQTPQRGGAELRTNLLQRVLAPLVWILLVVALARPQYVEPPIEKTESARDLMLAVDLSGSMETRDMFDPDGNRISRLDVVKMVLGDFIERREADRIGVIVFGNQALVQAPFTQDHALIRQLLEQTEPRMAGPMTMLGDALGLSIKTFEQSEARDRVVILLTDGNDTGSKVPPTKAAEIAARHDLTVYPVAVGDPSSVGEAAMDIETLRAIADVTGGQLFDAADREELEQVYLEIDALTPEELETLSYRPTRPLYYWPLGGAVILIFLFHALMGIRVALRSTRPSHA